MRVFLDTNVLLDVFQERMPQYEASVAVWELAETGRVTGLVSVISFNNIYYIISKFCDRKHADRAIKLLRGTFSPVLFDEQILNQAIDSKINDFEDAIQFFSAVHAAADFIITRNRKDFPKTNIPVLTPEEFLTIIKSQDSTDNDLRTPQIM